MHTPLLERKVQQRGKLYLTFFFKVKQCYSCVTRLSITQEQLLAALLCSCVFNPVVLMDVKGLTCAQCKSAGRVTRLTLHVTM